MSSEKGMSPTVGASSGPKLGLEFLIAKQTRGTAEAYGLMDRGLLAPGHKADIVSSQPLRTIIERGMLWAAR